ncbi:MAG: M6 family metalloprotease domain-containing protein [Lentimicrobiaceae bacterium]|nr:M6 family metalloprotease domain-containing protein [Lentimicrobiaceae bacterium]
MKKIAILFLLFSAYFVSFGAYLENVPTQLVQPNGEVLNLFITGDEFYRNVHDSDGYSIVPGDDGWYYYALYDVSRDELVPSMYRVTMSRDFELPMEKRLGISQEKYREKRRAYFEPTGCTPSGASEKSILKDLAGAKSAQQMNNLVICIGFSDTQNMTNSFSYVDGMFNSNPDNNMRDYFSTMSYNKLDIVSQFFPPANGEVLRFYQDPNPRNYYQPYHPTNNPIGYEDDDYERLEREQTLLINAVNWINEFWPVPTSLDLDINNDGECDFISFVIQGNVGEWNDLLWPHKWSLYYDYVEINGKVVWEYNFELDGSTTYFSTNVFCHEGYHVLSAPDLYHYYNHTNLKAVNTWDIMDYSYLAKPQSMSAYLKYKYGNWVPTLPVATINKTYEIFPFYFNDGSNAEKPIIYRIPMTGTSTQYSVVEYRKRAGTNYDLYLSNEGFLIYRINANMDGNAMFNGTSIFDEVYLYRPGSSQTSGVYTPGNLDEAPYNPSNGKTAFNSTTAPKPCQSNGTAENTQNINNILYDSETDSYTFFYGDPENRNFSINKTELLLPITAGAIGTVTVNSNVLWRITIPAGATNWLSVSKAKGLNNGTVIFTALTENTAEEPRVANVSFTGNGQTYYVNVIQTKLLTFTVSLSENPSEGGTTSGGGIYEYGSEVTIQAIAHPNYDFVNWTQDDEIFSADAVCLFPITKDVNLVANFKLKEGINDIEKVADFKIYPNPTKEFLHIVRPTADHARIQIYNHLGTLINSFEINEMESTINVATLAHGLYFIKLNSFTQQFIKE